MRPRARRTIDVGRIGVLGINVVLARRLDPGTGPPEGTLSRPSLPSARVRTPAEVRLFRLAQVTLSAIVQTARVQKPSALCT